MSDIKTKQYYIEKLGEVSLGLMGNYARNDEEICLAAVRANWKNLEYIECQTNEICLAGVSFEGCALEFVKSQTDEICLAAVRKNGMALQFVENKTDEICLEAVKSNGWALQFVKNQTEEICLAAVTESGEAMQFVNNQTEEICLAAVKQDGLALRYVDEQTDEICLIAVTNALYALNHVKEQNGEMIDIAVNNSFYNFLVMDSSKYKYKPEQVNNALSGLYGDGGKWHNKINLVRFFNKLTEVLSYLSDDELVKAVNVDLKSIFDDKEVMSANDGLATIKQKVALIGVVGDVKYNNNNNKPKIL